MPIPELITNDVMYRKCTDCERILPWHHFADNCTKKNGKARQCKECLNKRGKVRRKIKADDIRIVKREYERKKLKEDPIFKLKKNYRKRLVDALKDCKANKQGKSAEYMGCTPKELKEHLEKQFKEGMTWENHGINGWHVDHIIPCCSFDFSKEEEIKKCFHYTNLQPLWWYENLQKGSKIL